MKVFMYLKREGKKIVCFSLLFGGCCCQGEKSYVANV